jgi:hypothetical protein
MSFPTYIPGTIAMGLTVAAALTPSEADGMSEVGFLRWAVVAIVAAGGVLGWKITACMTANTAALSELKNVIQGRSDRDHDLITEIAKEAMKP